MSPNAVFAHLSDSDRRETAKIYEMIGLRLWCQTEKMADIIGDFGFPSDLPRISVGEMTSRYERVSQEWRDELADQDAALALRGVT